SLGSAGFGTVYRERGERSGSLDGDYLPLDFAANARGLGAEAFEASTVAELRAALEKCRAAKRTAVVVVHTDVSQKVPGYASWWDVAVAEVSAMPEVRQAREEYVENRKKERSFKAH
ncbi:MAG TPA: thiamine pyrophosphate-dependent enzyme, partial [Anaerolineaceae bacterium]